MSFDVYKKISGPNEQIWRLLFGFIFLNLEDSWTLNRPVVLWSWRQVRGILRLEERNEVYPVTDPGLSAMLPSFTPFSSKKQMSILLCSDCRDLVLIGFWDSSSLTFSKFQNPTMSQKMSVGVLLLTQTTAPHTSSQNIKLNVFLL